MPTNAKSQFVDGVQRRFGRVRKLEHSQSLFEVGDGAARIYVRYSRVHGKYRTFYGLRQDDLRQLEGHNSVICFLWEGQQEPLVIPFSDYEEILRSTSPASDGQYKVQVYLQEKETELYIARGGRFNVEGHLGWQRLEERIGTAPEDIPADLSHSQVQTILGAIGVAKDQDVWIPPHDRESLDWSLASPFRLRNALPDVYSPVGDILREVDVVWIQRGASEISGLYEVEHSTPVYPALLRFNDIHLAFPTLQSRFVVVADDSRCTLFAKQARRPTFRHSGLADLCTFLEYGDAYRWYRRVVQEVK